MFKGCSYFITFILWVDVVFWKCYSCVRTSFFELYKIRIIISYINSLRLSVCDGTRVRHRQPTGPSPAFPEKESRRRNKGRDAQLSQPQRPELHRRAPTPGFIHSVSFTRSTPQSHPPGLLTHAWVAELIEST